jgi:hypothetical protein
MINKLQLQSIIDKYYLGINESVKWVINNNTLEINFMTPSRDVIGKVLCDNFKLEDSNLAIFDTKKLQNLISICSGDLLLELEKNKSLYTKLKISDINFNLTYALADPLLIDKVGTVNLPKWEVEVDLTNEDIVNIIKAKSALLGVDNMMVTTTKDLNNQDIIQFIFGDESGHNNKITYQILGKITTQDINLPFNSDILKIILQANKGMENGKLYLSSMGLMKLYFSDKGIISEYSIVRRAETNF